MTDPLPIESGDALDAVADGWDEAYARAVATGRAAVDRRA